MANFVFEIDGKTVEVEAPTLEAAQGVAQTIQRQMQQGGSVPGQAAYQGDAPTLTPDPVDARRNLEQGYQDFQQNALEGTNFLQSAGRGMLTGAADTALLGFDDELGGLLRGMWPGGETVREAVDANRAFKAEQDPTSMLLGGIFGGLASIPAAARIVPTLPFARGASTAARATNAAATTALGGGVYGAGSADGRPMLPYAGAGAAAGAVLGPLGPLLGSGVRGVSNLLRRGTGSADNYLNTRAAGILEGALARDAPTSPGGILSTGQPGQYLRRAADTVEQERALGMPIVLADTGGNATRRTMRASSNVSPNPVLDAELSGRYANQAPRVQDQLADITGMPRTPDTSGRLAGIEGQARLENRVRYDAAYNAPEAQAVWSTRLQELTRSPVIQDAMRGVNRTAANDAALLGQPAVRNPFTADASGALQRQPGVTPNLQYWDIVQRNLSDMIDNAVGGERRQLIQLRTALLDELDATVPAFATARAGAAAAFGARDALEAGQTMARNFNMETADFRRAFNQLSPAEQDLFREGYSNQLMDSISQLGDNRNVMGMSVFNSPKGRERTAIVFGQQAADEIEATVRLENVMNLTRAAAQGNSTTAQQLADMFRSPTAAAGAAGTGLALATGGVRWPALLAMGLTWGARKGQAALNEATASRVGALLASGDPQAIRQAASLLASTPVGNVALRNMEAQLSRVITANAANTGFTALEGMGALPALPN